MQCPTCKQVLDDGVKFCPNDGTPLIETSSARTVPTPTGNLRPASASELTLPVVIGGRFKLVQYLGGGGMAKVYKGTDLTLDREVAVKLINTELRNETEFDARFQREARIASQLADPHIVVVHDFGFDPEHGPYLVMEYLQGKSLREHLKAVNKMPLKAGLQLAGQLLLALIHAHEKGIIHRDIKPDNIFLLDVSGVRQHVRLLDFGIARIYRRDEPARSETLTHAGAVIGTARYMSPEQWAGQQVDVRSDLYSAALVIHEALTGEVPQLGGKRLCEACPEASPALQELLEQCLRPNASDRPQNAMEVYLRLQELGKASGILLLPPGAMDKLVQARQANLPTQLHQPSDPTGSHSLSLKQRILFGSLVVVVVLGLAALAKFLFFSPSKPNYEGPEMVAGIKIGDEMSDEMGDLTLESSASGHPWRSSSKVKDRLGHLLQPEDLGLKPEELSAVNARMSSDGKVCVLFYKDKVVAVVARGKGYDTARGLTGRAGVKSLYEKYPGGKEDEKKVDGESIGLRRYDSEGIGFEIRNGLISAIVLYPPKK